MNNYLTNPRGCLKKEKTAYLFIPQRSISLAAEVDEKMKKGMNDRDAFRVSWPIIVGGQQSKPNYSHLFLAKPTQTKQNQPKQNPTQTKFKPKLFINQTQSKPNHLGESSKAFTPEAAMDEAYEADPELRLVLGFRVSIREAPAERSVEWKAPRAL